MIQIVAASIALALVLIGGTALGRYSASHPETIKRRRRLAVTAFFVFVTAGAIASTVALTGELGPLEFIAIPLTGLFFWVVFAFALHVAQSPLKTATKAQPNVRPGARRLRWRRFRSWQAWVGIVATLLVIVLLGLALIALVQGDLSGLMLLVAAGLFGLTAVNLFRATADE